MPHEKEVDSYEQEWFLLRQLIYRELTDVLIDLMFIALEGAGSHEDKMTGWADPSGRVVNVHTL